MWCCALVLQNVFILWTGETVHRTTLLFYLQWRANLHLSKNKKRKKTKQPLSWGFCLCQLAEMSFPESSVKPMAGTYSSLGPSRLFWRACSQWVQVMGPGWWIWQPRTCDCCSTDTKGPVRGHFTSAVNTESWIWTSVYCGTGQGPLRYLGLCLHYRWRNWGTKNQLTCPGSKRKALATSDLHQVQGS